MRRIGLILLLLSAMVLRCPAQQTVTVTWYFTGIVGNSNGVTSQVIEPIVGVPWVNQSNFLSARPIKVSVATTPTLTNGSFSTNLVVGIPFRVTISDSYTSVVYTNFFQTNYAGQSVNAAIGNGWVNGPFFVYANLFGLTSVEFIQTNSVGPHGIVHTNQNGVLVGVSTY